MRRSLFRIQQCTSYRKSRLETSRRDQRGTRGGWMVARRTSYDTEKLSRLVRCAKQRGLGLKLVRRKNP